MGTVELYVSPNMTVSSRVVVVVAPDFDAIDKVTGGCITVG